MGSTDINAQEEHDLTPQTTFRALSPEWDFQDWLGLNHNSPLCHPAWGTEVIQMNADLTRACKPKSAIRN